MSIVIDIYFSLSASILLMNESVTKNTVKIIAENWHSFFGAARLVHLEVRKSKQKTIRSSYNGNVQNPILIFNTTKTYFAFDANYLPAVGDVVINKVNVFFHYIIILALFANFHTFP